MSNNSKKDKAGKIREQPETYIDERYEILKGVRYDFKPSPATVHQMLVTELYAGLRFSCNQQGIILVAPMDVYLDEYNIVQPDVIYITNEQAHIVTPRRIEGAPDLMVEILSPSTGSRDKTHKKDVYARFGVQEYWIVDPYTFTLDQFVLAGAAYHLLTTYAAGDTLLSEAFPSISIDLRALFAPLDRFREE